MPLPQSKNRAGLGHAIINRVAKDARQRPNSEFHTTDVSSSSKHGLASVTQQGDLEEFLNTAQLADQDFTAERRNVTVVQTPGVKTGGHKGNNPFLLNGQEEKEVLGRQRQNKTRLRVPRRPAWDAKTTPAALSTAEKNSFLEWRRSLAQLTEAQNFILTPFERNIEVWRQLWRVLERSHLVVQIVDARNPLKFRCEDLERYVESLGVVSKSGLQYVGGVGDGAEEDGAAARAKGQGPRRNLLLINKADLLDQGQRETWARYFDEHGIRYAFFSAADAAAVQEAAKAEEEAALEEAAKAARTGSDSDGDSDSEAEEDAPEVDTMAEATRAVSLGAHAAKPLVGAEAADRVQDSSPAALAEMTSQDDAVDVVKDTAAPLAVCDPTSRDPTRVLNVLELEELFMASAPPLDDFTNEHGTPSQLVVGLVGYPNVGKSSTINALLGSKKVSVSATPGKTKHFQTLPFSERVTLCDCPGLVFPQFATSTGELVVDGVLPIDQMREYTAPAELVARRIPREIIEGYYGIRVQTLDVEEGGTGQPTGLEVLTAYAIARGFVRQGQGNPDESRAARYVLKDYVNAKLLYCSPPPGVSSDEYNAEQRQRAREALKGRRYDPALADAGGGGNLGPGGRPLGGAKSRALDAAFFATGNAGGVQMKGRKGLPGRGVVQGRLAADGTPLTVQGVQQAQPGPGKKHYKRREGKIRYAGAGAE
ncbi:unnamed protein product [Parajaminaea phylloscopi]